MIREIKIWYNTFVFYSKLNCDIKMYGLKLPKTEVDIEILGKKIKVISSANHDELSDFFTNRYK